MYILIKTDSPEEIYVEHNSFDKRYSHNNPHFIYAKTPEEAKNSLDSLHDIDDSEYWQQHYPSVDEKSTKNFTDYLTRLSFATNKLSNKEIEELCSEYITFLPEHQRPAQPLKIHYIYPSHTVPGYSSHFPQFIELQNILTKYAFQTGNRSNLIAFLNFHHWSDESYFLYRDANSGGLGFTNSGAYILWYYIDYLGMKIPEHLKDFWKFYKKTLDVFFIYLYNNEMYVMKRPEQHYIQDGIVHLKFDKNHYYCNQIKVPEFVYKTTKENADIYRLNEIKNAAAKNLFIKKAGIEKFIKHSEIVDTWKNYPDNELFANYEYQLIDLSKILCAKMKYNNICHRKILCLCKKNQTTGEYHMKGVSPECKDLYDALKTQYDLLYKIKNIKKKGVLKIYQSSKALRNQVSKDVR